MSVELLKLRHTHVLLLGGALSLGIVLIACMNIFAGDQIEQFTSDPHDSWASHLIGVAIALAFLTPLQAAIIASRTVDNEHANGGWLLNAVAGIRRGTLLRRKLRVVAPLMVALKLVEVGASVALPAAMGAPLPAGSVATAWVAYGAAAVVTSLAITCIMLVLATVTDSQIGVLTLGVVGGFLGIASLLSPAWLAAINPFGYFAVVLPYTFADDGVAFAQPHWVLWAAYAICLAAAFAVATRYLNTKEI